MEVSQIPLEKLHYAGSEDAIRKIGAGDGIEELKKNIEMFGLLVPLLVRPDPESLEDFIVIDGNRRLAALRMMSGPGDGPDRKVTCVVGNAEEVNTGAALSANTMRQAMNVMDEYDVYAKMIAQGNKPNTIARVFGRKQKEVAQILALAGLHDEIKNKIREEKIGWETAHALTLIKDREEQVRYFKECGDSHWKIRQALLGRKPLFKYALFSRQAYELAGGTFVVDLFQDAEEDEICETGDIFWGLQNEQIELQLADLRAQGWNAVVKCDRSSYKADCPERKKITGKKKRKEYIAGYSIYPDGQFQIHERVEPTKEKRKADKEALKELAAPASAASQKNGDDREKGDSPEEQRVARAGGHEYSDHDVLILIRNVLEQNEWSGSLCGKIVELLEAQGIEVLPDRHKIEEEFDPETGEIRPEMDPTE